MTTSRSPERLPRTGAPAWGHLRIWCLLPLLLLQILPVHAKPEPARFTLKGTEPLVTKEVGPAGAEIRLTAKDTPLDGIVVVIPPGALPRVVKVVLSRCQGDLSLRGGKGSGVYLKLEAESVTEFSKPIEIRITFDPALIKDQVPVGYAIDAKGGLEAIDSAALDRTSGKASFMTQLPLLFTWVTAPL